MAAMAANSGIAEVCCCQLPGRVLVVTSSCTLLPGTGGHVHQGRHSEARRRDRQAGVAPAMAHHAPGRMEGWKTSYTLRSTSIAPKSS